MKQKKIQLQIQPQTKNTLSLETLPNPTKIITPPAANTALTTPKIILTPPDTAESIELLT